MTGDTTARLWFMRLGFCALALMILFANMLPIKTSVSSGWPGIDALMVLSMAWAVRRPDYVPALGLAAVFLLADLLLQRPPGLWAVLMLLACERLKAQAHILRDASVATEYLTVGALIVLIYVANRLILGLTLVDLPSLGLYLLQMIMTLFAYPVAVFVTHVFLGVRKMAASETAGSGL